VFRRTMRRALGVALASGLLSACASSPPYAGPVAEPARTAAPPRLSARGAASAPRLGALELGIDGALPVIHTHSDPLLASRVGIGGGEIPLRYDARYVVEPGAVFAAHAAGPNAVAPAQLMGQRVGQDLSLRLPEVVGAPAALRISAETRELWSMGGVSVTQQRQIANLEWSPRLASLSLQWVGGDGAADAQLALGCELRGTLRVPMPAGEPAGSGALRLSARDCHVLTTDPRYESLSAGAWAAALAWSAAQRETELRLAMIDPSWMDAVDRQRIDPGYELGVSHRRDHGSWSAGALVAVRYATAWDVAASSQAGAYVDASNAYWTASASLTRHLPAVSLSATLAHAADPMWFIPDIGQRSHRVDMHLDFSRAISGLLPDAKPQLGMQWNWSQARSRSDTVTADGQLRLNMSVLW
jgi:hypothetical protein